MPTKARKEENPAVQEIANLLALEFNQVEPQIKGDLKKAYRKQSKDRHDGLLERMKEPERTGRIYSSSSFAFQDWYHHTSYAKDRAMEVWRKKWPGSDLPRAAYTEMPPDHPSTWEDLRKWVDYLAVDYRMADHDSAEAFDRARDSFISKNVGKVRTVLEARTQIKATVVKFGYHRNVFTGSIEVQLADGSFEAEIGLKYVIRTVPRVTPYFQYPMNFTTATVGGARHNRPSEEELRLLLGGKPRRSAELELVANGFCPMSGQAIPYSPETAFITNACSPYMRCPTCKVTVSVKNFKWRKHLAAGQAAVAK